MNAVRRPGWTVGRTAAGLLAVGVSLVAAAVPTVGAAAAAAAAARAPFVPAPTAPRPTPSAPVGPSAGSQSSLNWAGYAVSGGHFSSVSGSWTQPAVSCPTKKSQLAAFWVGLDGYSASDPTVQQIGTDSDCVPGKRVSGGPSYYAWFEMYPSALVVLPSSVYPVAPGDRLSASVSVYGSGFFLALVDAGRWTYTTVQIPSAPPADESAEWIAEAPTSCHGKSCKVVKLADFGAVAFTGAHANGAPVSSFADSRITMVSGKKVKAQTSALSSGSDFTVAWQHS